MSDDRTCKEAEQKGVPSHPGALQPCETRSSLRSPSRVRIMSDHERSAKKSSCENDKRKREVDAELRALLQEHHLGDDVAENLAATQITSVRCN